ncbi:MAG: arylsulfatase [Bacteroidales bacterium]|nr:arylsulfatase [Bacteroidales bacterium]
MKATITACAIASLLINASCNVTEPESSKPNVILILTDDQGYSHLGATGHPDLKTPNIDKFAEDAVRLTNFHQELLSAPSRASLLTGRYSARTGTWRTSAGRAIMRTEETTIAELLKAHGYKTAHFGKWHLGDNYPFRSEDQGFDEVVTHKAGGVGQISDYWGNDYFDDSYYHNGVLKKFDGYCADVWFNEARRYIKEVKSQPFFIYIASNTPHSPYNVAPEYVQPYLDMGIPKKTAQFYGMIANLDENFGRLLSFLDEEALSDNTIVIFTTDDGGSGGSFETHDGSVNGFPLNGFNAGLRGRKASVYEGGHKTFFFMRWPDGNIAGGKNIGGLTAGWDIFPTLADLCQIEVPAELKLDGKSLKPLLDETHSVDWEDRSLFIQLHGGVGLRHIENAPHHYLESAVLKGDWRLINGKELYNLSEDLLQENNIADSRPEIVDQLKKEYLQWFNTTTTNMNEASRIVIGSDQANPVELSTQDSYTFNTNSASSVGSVLKLSQLFGPWKIHVEEDGEYNIKVSRYPVYTNNPIGFNVSTGKSDLIVDKVRIMAGETVTVKTAESNDSYIDFNLNLKRGDMDFQAWFIDINKEEYPAYFVLVEKL